MKIGTNIKKLRKLHGETQQQLGAAIGVVQQSVAAWESNRCKPDVVSLVAISAHYNVSCDYILGIISEPIPPTCLSDRASAPSSEDAALSDKLPEDIRDGVLALIRMERAKSPR